MYGGVGRSNLCVWGCREVQLMCMEVWGGPAYVYGCGEVQLMCMEV